MINKKIKDIMPSERPYEKFISYGEQALSDSELLAIILRTGTVGINIIQIAQKIVALCNLKGGIGYLNRLTYDELLSIDGIGKIKAAQIKCLCELCKRMWIQDKGELKKYNSPKEISDYYLQYVKGLDVEEVRVLFMDSRNHIIKDELISKGCINASIISAQTIFSKALTLKASGIIVIHNHPSGDITPSKEDRFVTQKLHAAGEVLEIILIDHIILGDHKYYSFKENNLL